MTDWQKIRADFPILRQEVHGQPLVYFDSAATTQKPRQVLEAVNAYYERDNSNVHRGVHELSARATAAFEAARERVAQFIHARSADEIVFTRGSTEGINLAAQSWGREHLRAGDQILLTEMEHHSNLVPWQLLARQTGAELRFVPVSLETGMLDLSQMDELLGPRAKLFAFAHISNNLGAINPAKDLCALARERGIATLVDAAQSAGHAPVDVRDLGCDFLVFSGHKLCAPTGIGVLYGRAERLAAMPPWQGGGEMISQVDFDRATFKAPPHCFEAGTPDIAGAIGLHAALDYLDGIGREQIFQHDLALALYARERLLELKGVRVLGPKGERGALVSFLMEGIHAHDIATFADRYGVALRGGHHCSQPLMRKLGVEATARASFYLYNTSEEVDRFIAVMEEAQKFFGEKS